VADLHRETVDAITIPSQKNPGTHLKRVDEVFDCWFESGSMPYAQSHYPFENKDGWEKGFPADFIAEGLDQTRGWFYTLMVLSTALFDKPAFKNNIVNGMVLASDGQKMSKRKKNYPDPTVVIDRYGADALRMYLVNSPVVRAESLKFREDGVLGVVKEVFLPLYNAFRFFLQNVERWEAGGGSATSAAGAGRKFVPSQERVRSSSNPTDVWIQAETQGLIKFVHDEMGAYRLYTVMPALVKFGTQLTNWYVRLNRDRLKGLEGEGAEQAEADAESGLQVLYDVLLDVTVLMAPFTPFITEFFYQHLRKLHPAYAEASNGGGTSNPVAPGKSDSVHFLRLPEYDETRLNRDAVESMEALQAIVEQGRCAREKRNISLRTPVRSIVAVLRSPGEHVVANITGPLKKYVLSELNAWEFTVVPKDQEHDWVTLSLSPNFKALGRRLGRKMPAVQKAVQALSHEVRGDVGGNGTPCCRPCASLTASLLSPPSR
jgi:isoleucyl-tRNA synthetase